MRLTPRDLEPVEGLYFTVTEPVFRTSDLYEQFLEAAFRPETKLDQAMVRVFTSGTIHHAHLSMLQLWEIHATITEKPCRLVVFFGSDEMSIEPKGVPKGWHTVRWCLLSRVEKDRRIPTR